MGERKQANPRLTLKITKQYPVTSLNGKRFAALRDYFGDDLERHMIQAMWSVLGPLGSSLAELPEKDVQGHINSSKLLVKGFHQEALDMIGGGEALPDELDKPETSDKPAEQAVTPEVTPEVTEKVTSEVTPEQPPSATQESVYSASAPEQSGDPLNNLF